MDEDGYFEQRYLRRCTSTNVVGRGMPTVVHHVVSDPRRFGFDVAIHLRLLVVWGSTPSIRSLQRSVAVQLGIVDDGHTRALLDEADEEDDYRGVEEEKRGLVEEVTARIHEQLKNKRYLLVLENVPDDRWDGWLLMGIPLPDGYNRCRVVLSSSQRLQADILGRISSRDYFFLPYHYEPDENIKGLAEVVAASINKMMDVTITPEHVIMSLLYWWLYKPFDSVPVEELVNSWVHAEVVVSASSPSSSSASNASPHRGGGGGGGGGTLAIREPWLGWLEVGKALLEELCRQYLLKVERRTQDNGVARSWYRQPLDVRHPLRIHSGAGAGAVQGGSFSWMGASLEKQPALFVRGDGTAAVLSLAHIASAFRINYDDGDPELRVPWGLLQEPRDDDDYNIEDDAKAWSGILKNSGGYFIREEAELLESLATLFVARQDAAPEGQPHGRYNLRHIDIIPDDLLIRMPHLRLLDLSYTNISSLPDSLFFRLPELRVLLLQHCKRLVTLAAPPSGAALTPRPTSTLHKLQVLDLSNSSVRDISDDVLLLHMTSLEELLLSHGGSLVRLPTLRMLRNLRVFRLTHTSMGAPLPEELFGCKSWLRVLDLSHNRSIKSLPASLSTVSSTLEEIYLYGCAGLEHVEGTGLLLQHMPSLRVFTISDSPINRLSFRGCSRLETIKLSNLERLEVLDLSGTGIRELPVEILNLPRLRRLDLLGVQQLRRIPWRAAKRIPQVLNLDQCSCDLVTGGPAPEEEPTTGSQRHHIFATDPRILSQNYSSTNWPTRDHLSDSLVDFIRENLPCFYVCISPCNHRVEAATARRCSKVRTRRVLIPYETIQPIAEKMVKKGVSLGNGDRLQRHVDVQGGGDRFLHAASMFLGCADSLSLHDHHHYGDNLTDLSLSGSWKNLKRCRLERCHNMDCVFYDPQQFECLESLWISKLPRLTEVWNNRFSYGDETTAFKNLRYVHLEYCPRVVWVFPTDIHLQSLENLVIKSCPRLEHVFAPYSYRQSRGQLANLSGLKGMELLDLPSLESISRGKILSPRTTWKLKVRGCWKLRELPTMIAQPGKVSVEIDGEPKWWNNLAINNNTITVIKKK